MNKFILFSAVRSGGTVVGLSVFKHPEVLYYHELFHAKIRRRVDESSRKSVCFKTSYLRKEHRYSFKHCAIDDNGYDYLNDFYSRSVPFKSIGFKLLSNQAFDGRNGELWNYIEEHTEIKIIHIQRANMLENICSVARADMRGVWHTRTPIVTQPLEVTVDNFKRYIWNIKFSHPSVNKFLKTHNVLNLEYEQICSDFQRCMVRVFEFLEVRSDIKCKPMLSKIANLQPNEEILNYKELKEHFKETRYGKYFIY